MRWNEEVINHKNKNYSIFTSFFTSTCVATGFFFKFYLFFLCISSFSLAFYTATHLVKQLLVLHTNDYKYNNILYFIYFIHYILTLVRFSPTLNRSFCFFFNFVWCCILNISWTWLDGELWEQVVVRVGKLLNSPLRETSS